MVPMVQTQPSTAVCLVTFADVPTSCYSFSKNKTSLGWTEPRPATA